MLVNTYIYVISQSEIQAAQCLITGL